VRPAPRSSAPPAAGSQSSRPVYGSDGPWGAGVAAGPGWLGAGVAAACAGAGVAVAAGARGVGVGVASS
jgi:hypothetical protein